MHRSELQSAAGVSPIPTVVMEIPKEVCNLKDRRSDLYEVRVKDNPVASEPVNIIRYSKS